MTGRAVTICWPNRGIVARGFVALSVVVSSSLVGAFDQHRLSAAEADKVEVHSEPVNSEPVVSEPVVSQPFVSQPVASELSTGSDIAAAAAPEARIAALPTSGPVATNPAVPATPAVAPQTSPPAAPPSIGISLRPPQAMADSIDPGTLPPQMLRLPTAADHADAEIAKMPWLLRKLTGNQDDDSVKMSPPRPPSDFGIPPSLSSLPPQNFNRPITPKPVAPKPIAGNTQGWTAVTRPPLRQPTREQPLPPQRQHRAADLKPMPQHLLDAKHIRRVPNAPQTDPSHIDPSLAGQAMADQSIADQPLEDPPSRQQPIASAKQEPDSNPSGPSRTESNPSNLSTANPSPATPPTTDKHVDASEQSIAPEKIAPEKMVQRDDKPRDVQDRNDAKVSRPVKRLDSQRVDAKPLLNHSLPTTTARGSISDLRTDVLNSSRRESARYESARRVASPSRTTPPADSARRTQTPPPATTPNRSARQTAPASPSPSPQTEASPRPRPPLDYTGRPIEPTRLTRSASRLRAPIRSVLSYFYNNPEVANRRSNWGMLHAMMVYGVDTRVIVGQKDFSTIAWIAGNNACRGQRLFDRDAEGIVTKSGVGLQGHQAQCLAIFSLCEVPRDYPIYVDGEAFSVDDMVRREMLDCRSGEELTFTLIALSHYLDTDQTWLSRDGQRWSIERLIREELSQPVVGAACGGTHRLMGFGHALRNRRIDDKPLTGQWARAQTFVDDFVNYTYRLQNRDGSMSTDWFEGREDNGSDDRKVQTTGHMVEFLLTVLPDSQLQEPRLVAAINYLSQTMRRDPRHDWSIGPKGHALRSLAMYYERVYKSGTAWQKTSVAGNGSPRR